MVCKGVIIMAAKNKKQECESKADLIERGKDVRFSRIRRITGYLSSVYSFNDAKKAELADRVKHG